MESEARLAAALGASAAPARDPGFTLAVIRGAEQARFKAAAAASMLRWGGLAAVVACLVLILAGWTSVNWAGVEGGIMGVGAIFALVAMGRRMTQRLAPATVR
ncbi:MAG: hypothetical protein NT015_08690 [Alphaproteobacteria bacterium]|nr:hypothetical protein [Alphaproteobacteria bacterium]